MKAVLQENPMEDKKVVENRLFSAKQLDKMFKNFEEPLLGILLS